MENTKQSQYEADDYMKNIIINTEPELITFLLDILEYGENIESEEILLEDTSYKILYLLLKNILPLTVLVEEKYIDKILYLEEDCYKFISINDFNKEQSDFKLCKHYVGDNNYA